MNHREEKYHVPGVSPSQLSFHWHPMQNGAGAAEDEPIFGSSPRTVQKLKSSYSLPEFFDRGSKLNVRFC
eukprot:SAG31_NODE_15291_length_762_cov_0.906486_1_plen_69_part_10